MDCGLKDAVFLITGGARGIGATTAELAGREGARVAILDIDTSGADTAGQLRQQGIDAQFFACDLTKDDEVQATIAQVAEQFGGIDVVFNNAGIADAMLTDQLAIDQLPGDVWDRVFALNAKAPFLVVQAAYPHLKRSERAAVVNVGSVGSYVAYPKTLAYGASKGAVALLTKNLAVELAADKIRVNAVCPGVTETQMAKDYLASKGENAEEERRRMAATNLIERLGDPEDIANAVLFLAGSKSQFITGNLLLVDGGSLAWRGERD